MAGTLTITGLATGLLSGEKVIGPLTITGAQTVGTITDITFAAGDNTISIPTGAVAVLVSLASSNTALLKLRTSQNSSDAGLQFGPTGFLVLPLRSGATSLTVNAAAAATAEISFI